LQGRDRTFFFSFFFSCFLRFLALFDSELGVELADEAAAGDEAVVVVVGATAGLTGVAGAAAAGAEAAAGLGLPNEESPEKSKRSVEAELATIVEMDEVEVDDDVDDDDEEAVLAEVAGGTNEGNLKGISKLSSYCSSPSLLSSSSSRFRLVTGCSN
jgi:hypothetical protein